MSGHPENHFRCADCPCACDHREPYEAQAGTMCLNCSGMIERKFTHRFAEVAKAGGITIMTSVWDPV
jgi:hypothetical protein